MPHPEAPGLPAPALFDVTTVAPADPAGTLVRVALDELELAPNARREIAPEGIERLARMLMTMGQLVPCIGHRPAGQNVMLYAGQRRLLAARLSHTLAADGLKPVRSLIVTLLDHVPSDDEIRRIQAQENQREDLTLSDQQAVGHAGQPAGRHARGRPRADRGGRPPDLDQRAARCRAARSRRLRAPHGRRGRVGVCRADRRRRAPGRPAPARARAGAPHRGRAQAAGVLGCAPDELDGALDALTAKAKSGNAALRVDTASRARTGRYAYVNERGPDFAAGIWVVDPVFMLDAVRQALEQHDNTVPAADPAYFAGAGLDAADLRDAAAEEGERRHEQRQRQAEAVRTNLGLGHDLRAGLIDPSPAQLDALRGIVCHLLARDYRDVIAYGAGWTDPERQRPVGESARHEPIAIDAIVEAELRRALEEPDPLRGIAALVTRCAAAFVLDPDGATRTKVLGSERMSRKLGETLPGGDEPLRSAVWAFLRPMLSPRLAGLHRDAFVLHGAAERSTVHLAAHRGDSTLDDLDLDPEEETMDAAA